MLRLPAVLTLIIAQASLAADPVATQNAADIYRKAIKQLDDVPKDWDQWPENWEQPVDSPLTARQQSVVQLTHGHFEMLLRAEDIKTCRFDFKPFNPVTYQFPPEYSGLRKLGRLAELRMKHHVAGGWHQQAIDEMGAVLVFARRVGSETPTLIGVMVQISIDNLATDDLAGQLPRMTRKARTALEARLTSLPSGGTIHAAAKAERGYMTEWLEREYLKDADKYTDILIKGAEASRAFTNALLKEKDAPFDPTNMRKLQALAKTDAAGYAKVLREAGVYWDNRVGLLALPPADREKAWDEFTRQPLPANPMIPDIVQLMTNGLNLAARTELAGQSRVQMIRAGIAYLNGGDEAFRKIHELHTREPFELTKSPAGFELRSRHYKFGDDWVKLHFGIEKPLRD